jgi:serine/threonine-protein kinase
MPYRVGRYQVHEPIASGGMAVVHLGRIVGPVGFSRTVAIKRLHPHLATDPEFVTMFLDEARLAARVQHPNVVATLDVVASHGQLFLVMDFVLGASLSQLLRHARERHLEPPPAVASAIVTGALYGLHAAHGACDQRGESLGIVHRDISPQNLLVGVDGVTRVVDFGVAKAGARAQSTRDGQIKGKIGYMAPEQILRKVVDRRADVYAAGVVLWETLTLRRLFAADDAGAVVAAVLEGHVPRPSEICQGLPPGIDAIVARALASDPRARFPTAQDFAAALESALPPAPQREVGAWVARAGGADIDVRRGMVSAVEQSPAIESDADDKAVEGLVGHKLSEEEARKLATALTGSLPFPEQEEERDTEIASAATTPPRRAAGRWVGAAMALAAVTAGAILMAARSSPRSGTPSAATPPVAAAASASGAAASSDSLEPRTRAEPSPSAARTASAAAPAASSSATRATTSSPTHRTPTSPVGPPRQPASAHGKRADCDPPFSVDTNGVKRFKPWCI